MSRRNHRLPEVLPIDENTGKRPSIAVAALPLADRNGVRTGNERERKIPRRNAPLAFKIAAGVRADVRCVEVDDPNMLAPKHEGVAIDHARRNAKRRRSSKDQH